MIGQSEGHSSRSSTQSFQARPSLPAPALVTVKLISLFPKVALFDLGGVCDRPDRQARKKTHLAFERRDTWAQSRIEPLLVGRSRIGEDRGSRRSPSNWHSRRQNTWLTKELRGCPSPPTVWLSLDASDRSCSIPQSPVDHPPGPHANQPLAEFKVQHTAAIGHGPRLLKHQFPAHDVLAESLLAPLPDFDRCAQSVSQGILHAGRVAKRWAKSQQFSGRPRRTRSKSLYRPRY
jgi:hypothetical protein